MIAFIDCYIEEPVYNCVNDFVQNTQIPATYHAVSKFGIDSLKQLHNTTHYIILGSASHVHENLDWHKELLDFILPVIQNQTPVLGICFGHQLLAHHYGCTVDYYNHDQTVEKTIRKIQTQKSFFNFEANTDLYLPYAHGQSVRELSDSFEVLAGSKEHPHDIVRLKDSNYYGIQAHPESSLPFIQNDVLNKYSIGPQSIKNLGTQFLLDFYTYTKNC